MRAPGGVQAAANIAGVDRDSDRYLTAIMPKRQVTSGLTVFNETLALEESNEITRSDLR
jgi:hypothetical protein